MDRVVLYICGCLYELGKDVKDDVQLLENIPCSWLISLHHVRFRGSLFDQTGVLVLCLQYHSQHRPASNCAFSLAHNENGRLPRCDCSHFLRSQWSGEQQDATWWKRDVTVFHLSLAHHCWVNQLGFLYIHCSYCLDTLHIYWYIVSLRDIEFWHQTAPLLWFYDLICVEIHTFG